MARPLILAAVIALASPAAASTVCTDLARLSYLGTVDGLRMAPLIDGVEEALTAYDPVGMDEERAVAASYLAGYASGLVYSDPAETAADFYAACISEDA